MKFRILSHAAKLGAATAVLWTAGCAATPAPEVKIPEPVVEVPAVPDPKHVPVVEPPKPVIPPEIAALREAVKNGNRGEIENRARMIIDANPESEGAVEALIALAGTAFGNGEFSKALLYAETAQNIVPKDTATMILRARILHRLDRSDDAVKLLEIASAEAPENPEPLYTRAAILIEFLDTGRALEAAKKAYEIASELCNAKIIYADALFAAQNYKEAVEIYESAASCEQSENMIKNMARLYEVHVPNPQKSCALYKILAERHPDNEYYKASRDYQCGL